MSELVQCPTCKSHVKGKPTRYGDRYECCGNVGWNGRRMVNQELRDLRKEYREVFSELEDDYDWKPWEIVQGIKGRLGVTRAEVLSTDKLDAEQLKEAILYMKESIDCTAEEGSKNKPHTVISTSVNTEIDEEIPF